MLHLCTCVVCMRGCVCVRHTLFIFYSHLEKNWGWIFLLFTFFILMNEKCVCHRHEKELGKRTHQVSFLTLASSHSLVILPHTIKTSRSSRIKISKWPMVVASLMHVAC